MKPLIIVFVVVCSMIALSAQRFMSDRELERCSGLLAEKIAPLESLK